MEIKKIGALVCCIALLSGCNIGSQVSKLASSHVEAQDNSQEEITLSGRAEPYQEVLVSPSIEGKIKNIFAELGSYVKQGQKLAELDEGDLPEKVKKAVNQVKMVEAQGNLTSMEQQIALNQTMATLNQVMVGLNTSLPLESPNLPDSPSFSGFPELDKAKIAVEDAEISLNEVSQKWTEINGKFNNGLVSKEEMNQVTNEKNKAERVLERANKNLETETSKANIQQKYEKEVAKYKQEKAKYNQQKAKYEQEKSHLDKKANQATQRRTNKSAQDTVKLQKESSTVTALMTKIGIEDAKVNLETIRAQYKNLPVVAPVNGFITEKNGRIGEIASQGTPLFTVTNLDKLYISIDVPESMINKWKENQQVKVMIPTQGFTTDGKVVYIGLMPNKDEQTYPVKVLIDNANHKIRGGMKAVVSWKMKSGNNGTQ